MKKNILLFFILLLSLSRTLHADIRGDYSLGLGVLAQRDTKVKETFGSDFFIRGNIGIIDDNGWELRGNLGNYNNLSHHPDDVGKGVRLNITPLTGSLIYNLGNGSQVLQPYLGGGAGAYFYNVSEDLFGNLESGTKFGFHLLAGLKLNLSPSFFIVSEYQRDYVPKFFFNNAANANTYTITLGIGFYFPRFNDRPSSTSPASSSEYRYNKAEEMLLSDIQQLTTEIKEMKDKRKELEYQIESYYETNNDDPNSPESIKEFKEIRRNEKKVKDLDAKIKDAEKDLDKLKQQWQNNHRVDTQPVENHIVYLRENYGYSPYNLGYNNGYFTHHGETVSPRYYNSQNFVSPPPTTKQALEEKKQVQEDKKTHINEMKNR